MKRFVVFTSALMLGVAASASAGPIIGTLSLVGSVDFQTGAPVVVDEIIDFHPYLTADGLGGFLTVETADGYFSGMASTFPGGPFFGGKTIDLTNMPPGAAPDTKTGPQYAPAGLPISVDFFLHDFTAPGFGGLTFELTKLPFAKGDPCDGSEKQGDSCVAPASPFTLTYTKTSKGDDATEVQFTVEGTFRNGDDIGAGFGSYGATFAGFTPFELLTAIFAGADLPGTSFSADYQSEEIVIPEPATLALLGGGLLAVVGARRRGKSRQ
jgi:hypothetical protein